MPEQKGIPNDIIKAAWGLGPPAPAAPDAPAAEPEKEPPAPDFGGGVRGRAPGNAPGTMDDVMRLAARGGLRDLG